MSPTGIFMLIALLGHLAVDVNSVGFRAMDKTTYDTISSLVRGDFMVPLAERTKPVINACRRYYRNKELYQIDEEGTLCLGGRKVAKESEIEGQINHAMTTSKGAGARKIRLRIGNQFTGISERRILSRLDNSRAYQMAKPRFQNKPVLRPVQAFTVHRRHQVDLINMRDQRVKHKGKTYLYVLSIMDIFSRYVWLKPLVTKTSKEVANKMSEIYMEHGPPLVLQHDQGGEFKKAVKKLMKKLRVRMISSSPYHPQSQGKVERSHRNFRDKLSYDLISLNKKGVNWASHLPAYATSLNNDAREELGWRTPFEVYFGRKNNCLVSAETGKIKFRQESNRKGVRQTPKGEDLTKFLGRRRRLRKAAGQASRRIAKRMINRFTQKNPPSIYKNGEEVLIRIRHGKHHEPKKYSVVSGVILKCNKKYHRYKVRFSTDPEKKEVEKWFPIQDITSVTRSAEKCRKKHQTALMSPKQKVKKALLIAKTHQNRLAEIGRPIRYNPPGDGNCQFDAIADQLESHGIYRSAAALRNEIVNDLIENPFDVSGTYLGNFVGNMDLQRYLENMAKDGTYGDHIVLQRVSELFNLNIIVVSSVGPHANAVVSPTGFFDDSLPTILLGHFAEGQGDHYVSLFQTPGEIADIIEESNNIFRLENLSAQDTRQSLPDLSYYGPPDLANDTEPVYCHNLSPSHQENSSDRTLSLSSERSWPVAQESPRILPDSPMFSIPARRSVFSASQESPPSVSADGPLSVPLESPLSVPLENPLSVMPRSPLSVEQESPHRIQASNQLPKSPENSAPESHSQYEAVVPRLPPEILLQIIRETLFLDMGMIGIFNRVSPNFKKLTASLYPSLHIHATLAEELHIVGCREKVISIRKIYTRSGRGSGISLRLKEWFGSRSNWINAWLILTAVKLSRFTITDVYWK